MRVESFFYCGNLGRFEYEVRVGMVVEVVFGEGLV